MVSRFSRPPRRPSWIAKRKNLNNSESLFRANAFHQVSAQSNLRLGRKNLKIGLEEFEDRPSWKLERNNFSNSESLCRYDASHKVLAQSDLRFGRSVV